MDRAYLKSLAKEQIKGKIGILFVITLVISALSGLATAILSVIPAVGPLIAAVVVAPAFALSIARIYLGLTQGKEPELKDTFSGFDDFFSAFKVTLLVALYTFLWSLLFVIPGIVKSFSYSMSLYILAENKGMSAKECIERSKQMTDGHKMDLFVLMLSFIGWAFVGAITLGIAYIWITPYMQTTLVNAYNSLKPVAAEPVAETDATEEAPVVNEIPSPDAE
jgi:uncharacterized membrane protein